jgi:hypothetical protein
MRFKEKNELGLTYILLHLDLLLHDCFVDPANPRLFLIRTYCVEQECHGAHNIPNAQTLGAAMINLHDHVQM